MKLFFEKNKEIKEIEFQGRLSELIKKLNLTPNSVVIMRGNEILTEDQFVTNDDELRIFVIVSEG